VFRLLRLLFGLGGRRRYRPRPVIVLPPVQRVVVTRVSRVEVTLVPPPVQDIVVIGRCYVIDGDTIDIKGHRIRLAGIDAPELDQPYGLVSKRALIKLCANQDVRAVFHGADEYQRAVATCYLPDGRDLSAELVKVGLALDWKKFSGGRYRGFEPADARRKLWRVDARQKGRMPPP